METTIRETAGMKIMASLEHWGPEANDGKHTHAILSIFSDHASVTLLGQTGEQQRLADMLQKAASDLQQRINSERAKEQ